MVGHSSEDSEGGSRGIGVFRVGRRLAGTRLLMDYRKIRCAQPIARGENTEKQTSRVLFGALTVVVLSKYRFTEEKLSTVAQKDVFFFLYTCWDYWKAARGHLSNNDRKIQPADWTSHTYYGCVPQPRFQGQRCPPACFSV